MYRLINNYDKFINMNKTIEPTASSNSFIKYTPDILFYPSNKMKQQK